MAGRGVGVAGAGDSVGVTRVGSGRTVAALPAEDARGSGVDAGAGASGAAEGGPGKQLTVAVKSRAMPASPAMAMGNLKALQRMYFLRGERMVASYYA